ncbi:MAG: long-chain fatty acid--CoA ligase [Bacteroidales bacterium]|nr:long-chain fatty acid--CoA ligase [Bacteroidales bacterium]
MSKKQKPFSRNTRDITRLFDILTYYSETFPNQTVALSGKTSKGWISYSPQEYKNITDNLSYAFMKLGIEPGDKVGIISSNRPEWNMLDMAIMQIGAITVPVYPTISEDDYKYIINHSEMKLAVIEGHEVMTKFSNILPETPNLQMVYTFKDRKRFPYFAQLVQLGEENPNPEELKRRRDSVLPEDCSTIMYTSGTTGLPKGVMLSHYNIVSQLMNLRQTPALWSDKALSFLPLCHAYERMLVFLYQYLGMTVYYVQSLATIGENIKEVRPTMMSAVPRVLEKMFDKIMSAKKSMKPLPRKIFTWAMDLAQEYKLQDQDRTGWYNFRHWFADKLIYRKIRKQVGGNFDIVVSGAASIQPKLASFFSAIGMPVFEGYGATETSPVIAVSCRDLNGREVGTVGFPLPGVEVRIAESGEILCRGHNVMMGYYKAPELTAEVIDDEGWYHTGDTGRFTKYGQVVITGRIKNLFKTSFGKYVNPQIIEEKFCESPFIENMVVVGENQKFAAAIISPDFEYLKTWCRQNNIPCETNEEMVANHEVAKAFATEIAKYNPLFGAAEQIKKFELVPEAWTQKNNILTPTLKVKRFIVQQQYKDLIDKIYK